MLKEIANLIVALLFVLSCSVQKGHARRNTITGGLVFSYDYNKINNERSTSEAMPSDGEQPLENDQQPLEKIFLTPLLTLETT
ncbi:MAG: hypothetical protein D3910_26110, partial [Candidatus Electrothrix sp. ATG2]|nr:hypothetical protein [Candidatus Electrothrix sp. ATG2]